MTEDCKHWKVQNRSITEEESFRLINCWIKKSEPQVVQEYHRDFVSEDKANTLSCVWHVRKWSPFPPVGRFP